MLGQTAERLAERYISLELPKGALLTFPEDFENNYQLKQLGANLEDSIDIPIAEIQIVKRLSQGVMSLTYETYILFEGEEQPHHMVVKTVPLDTMEMKFQSALVSEMLAMSMLPDLAQTGQVPKVWAVIEQPKDFYQVGELSYVLVSEWRDGVTLYDLVESREGLSIQSADAIWSQFTATIDRMYSESGIIYVDPNPGNIIVSLDSNTNALQVTTIDLGATHILAGPRMVNYPDSEPMEFVIEKDIPPNAYTTIRGYRGPMPPQSKWTEQESVGLTQMALIVNLCNSIFGVSPAQMWDEALSSQRKASRDTVVPEVNAMLSQLIYGLVPQKASATAKQFAEALEQWLKAGGVEKSAAQALAEFIASVFSKKAKLDGKRPFSSITDQFFAIIGNRTL